MVNIFNKNGKHVSTGKDLAIINNYARRLRGVSRINVVRMQTVTEYLSTIGGSASVRVHFRNNGVTAEVDFTSFESALSWAYGKRDRAGTWFSDCMVIANDAPLDDFTKGYIDAALWSSIDADGMPLDDGYDRDDITPELRAACVEDCQDFQQSNRAMLAKAYALYRDTSRGAEWSPESRAGMDFWLTRNRHGTGFWDRGFKGVGDALSTAAHTYGAIDFLYVGDDGKVYA